MTRLIARSADGWAVVDADGRRWMVKPPYRDDDRQRLTDAQAARALLDEDLHPDARDFDGWGDLCRYLAEQRVLEATPEEKERAQVAAAALLRRATPGQLEAHLAQLEKWLRDGRRDGVARALKAMRQAPAVESSPALKDRILELLTRALDAPTWVDSRRYSMWTVADEVSVQRCATEIRNRRCILLPAA
ncbi:MAG: hypothetical protein FJ265_01435 [Planctomycetes bacterium]|nr:hypothetical protein [Planctomycetota bacterium]